MYNEVNSPHSFIHAFTNFFIHSFIDTMEYIILCSIVIIGDIILLSTYYVLSALLSVFRHYLCYSSCGPPRWYCYLHSPRRTLGLGEVEQTFSRCLFAVMPAFVPVDTEMNKDPVSDLKGLTVEKREQDA